MNHLAYINYFEAKAKSHYLVQHGRVLAGSPTGKRVSFFRMNNDWEVQQAVSEQVDYPYMALPVYRGRLAPENGMVDDVMTGFFEIRQQVDNLQDFAAIEAAREKCKQIGLDIIASMVQESEDLGYCGPISGFEGAAQYDFTGPVNNNEFGCLFYFEFRDMAFNAATADLTGVFI